MTILWRHAWEFALLYLHAANTANKVFANISEKHRMRVLNKLILTQLKSIYTHVNLISLMIEKHFEWIQQRSRLAVFVQVSL